MNQFRTHCKKFSGVATLFVVGLQFSTTVKNCSIWSYDEIGKGFWIVFSEFFWFWPYVRI